MKISIIIPNYNSEKTISKTLNSIISQKMHNFEIIVVDDCSTDNSLQIISQYPKVNIIKNNKNHGPAYTRNKGIKNATGDILFFVDSDVYLEKNFIDILLREH